MSNILTEAVVRKATYELLQANNSTTALEVKNYLRSQNYTAFQQEVSTFLQLIATQDRLASSYNGKYHIYTLGYDTQTVAKKYLEKDNLFWEIEVEKNQLKIAYGLKDTDGITEIKDYFKNFIAIKEYNQLANLKLLENYQEVPDKRLSKQLKQKYANYFQTNPLQCTISYYNVDKIEFKNNEEIHKKAGYTFTWQLPSSQQSLLKLLASPKWTSKDEEYTYENAKSLGEKITQVKPASSNQFTEQLNLDNQNIFQIELQYSSQPKIILNKFELDLQLEIIPLTKKLLSTNL